VHRLHGDVQAAVDIIQRSHARVSLALRGRISALPGIIATLQKPPCSLKRL
jgi:hypothetical protein